MSRSAVFFDRDGVLNEAIVAYGVPHSPAGLQEFRLVPGAAQALGRLKAAGFVLVVVTNQPEVRRGRISLDAVEEMHARLGAELPLDAVYVCYHDAADACDCRKPKPGLLLRAAADLGLDLASSYFIGDRWRDVDAGAAAGCKTILIDYGYRERPPASKPDARVASLEEAVGWIIADRRTPR
jgi:D-glycero-D-manno-heptose 1,7-bisphosphate phosphatase